MSQKFAVGIDLGTTFSSVAVYMNGKVEVMANEETGFRTTPSYVAFTDYKETLVGKPAELYLVDNPESTIYDAKRLIGREYNDKNVQENLKKWPFKVISKDGKPNIEVRYCGETKTYDPTYISALLLEKMKKIAQNFLGSRLNDKVDAVITVPAYFNDAQRQATLDAAQLAGINVLKLINEPTAASVAYGLDKKFNDTKVLVFDFGGGTLDVSIVSIKNSEFKVLATSGDTHLGGRDIDEKLLDFAIKEIKTNRGIDITNNKNAKIKLLQACEVAKRFISTAQNTAIIVPHLCKGKNGADFHCNEQMTRARFEGLTRDILDKTLVSVETALADAKLNKSDINEVVLVGGSSKIPYVKEIVKKYFNGKELMHDINPDEAIASGAALCAASLMGDKSAVIQELNIKDITPLSLGIVVIGGVMSVILPRGSQIPDSQVGNYTNPYDNQDALRIAVYEGERPLVAENTYLGEFSIPINPCPRHLANVNVKFEINTNGVVKVTATDNKTSKTQSIEVKNAKTRLTQEEVQKMIKDAEKHKKDDQVVQEFIRKKNEFESFCFDVERKLDNDELKLDSNKKVKVKRILYENLDWIQQNVKDIDELTRKFQNFKTTVLDN